MEERGAGLEEANFFEERVGENRNNKSLSPGKQNLTNPENERQNEGMSKKCNKMQAGVDGKVGKRWWQCKVNVRQSGCVSINQSINQAPTAGVASKRG